MAVVDILLPRIVDHAEIAQPFDLGMRLQERADLRRIFARPRHAQLQRFQTAQQHPRRIGVADRADHIAHRPDDVDQRLIARNAARDQIAMPARIFGQAVNDQLGSLLDRLLPQRAQKGVVDGNGGFLLAREGRIARGTHRLDIDQRIGRVGRAFQIDQRHLAALFGGQRLGLIHHAVNLVPRRTRRKVEERDTKARQDARDQRFGRGIKRPRMHDHVILPDQRQQHRRNGGHAAGKDQTVIRLIPDRKPVLQYLLIGAVEARIDKAIGRTFALAGDMFKKLLPRRRAFKSEGGGQENRRLQRAFGQGRIIAMPHHQGRRL